MQQVVLIKPENRLSSMMNDKENRSWKAQKRYFTFGKLLIKDIEEDCRQVPTSLKPN